MNAHAQSMPAFGTLGVIIDRFAAIQRCMETMHACVDAGDAASIRTASETLLKLVEDARGDSDTVQRLVEELGASGVPEAAHILSRRGENEQAQSMMRLHALVVAIQRMQTQTASFVHECLDTLDAAKTRVEQRQSNGRLIGSA